MTGRRGGTASGSSRAARHQQIRPALKVPVNPLPWVFAESGWILSRQPRRGAVDLDRVITALPEGFVGGLVMEVDVANLPTRMESARAGTRYLKAHPAFVVAQS